MDLEAEIIQKKLKMYNEILKHKINTRKFVITEVPLLMLGPPLRGCSNGQQDGIHRITSGSGGSCFNNFCKYELLGKCNCNGREDAVDKFKSDACFGLLARYYRNITTSV
jgi:hypothetical protein